MNIYPETVDRLINQNEVASIIGVAPKTLERWRGNGTGPRFVRVGGRLARYRFSDVMAYVSNLG